MVEGGEEGFNLHGNSLHLQSGAILEADHLAVEAEEVILEELSVIDLNFVVRNYFFFIFEIHVMYVVLLIRQ